MVPSATRHNDQAEFEGLFTGSYLPAYRLAYRLTGNHSDAEDLTMEAYMRAWQAFERYDRRYPFIGWLLRILSNLAVDRWRQQKYTQVSLEQLTAPGEDAGFINSPLATHEQTTERQVLQRCLFEDINATLRQLAQPYRTAITLVDLQGCTYQEVAEKMCCSIGTVRSRLHRGRKLFREVWNNLYGETPVFCPH
jgi:RNA polymerase sigma-70 factor, ECF subfamily